MATIQRNILIRDRMNVKQNKTADSGLVNGTGLYGKGIGTAAYEAGAAARHANGMSNISRPIWTRPATVKEGGERFKTRFANMASRASVIADGIAVIKAARDVAEKTGNAELAALANNPKLNKAISDAVRHLGKSADSILRDYLASANDDPSKLDHASTANALTESDPNATAGLDSTAFTAWTPDAVAKREASHKRVVDMGAAIEHDTFQNAVRVRFGHAPVSVENEDLYALFEGKR